VAALQLAGIAPAAGDIIHFALVEVRTRLRELSNEHESLSVALTQKADDKLIKKEQLQRLTQAYRRGIGVNLIGVLGFFPIVSAPAITPSGSSLSQDAYHQSLRNIDATLAFRYYWNRFALVQARGGNRWDRADAFATTTLSGRGYAAVDVGLFFPLDDLPDDSGFQRGVGLGTTVVHYRCEASGGCLTDPGLGDPYPKTLPMDWRVQSTVFVEVRLLKELQFRIGTDYFIDKVHGTITGVDASVNSPVLRHLTPSLAVGSSFWGI